MKKAITTIFTKLGEFVLDKNGSGDEKRAYGGAFLIVALVYIFLYRDITGFIAIASVGTGLLGIAAVTDGIKGSSVPDSSSTDVSSQTTTGYPPRTS